MVKIVFIDANNEKVESHADAGLSLMEAALAANVEGIDAECGGGCSCATCHVRLSSEWGDQLQDPSEMEMEMLEFAEGFGEGSRLSCQIPVTDELEGIEVKVVARY